MPLCIGKNHYGARGNRGNARPSRPGATKFINPFPCQQYAAAAAAAASGSLPLRAHNRRYYSHRPLRAVRVRGKSPRFVNFARQESTDPDIRFLSGSPLFRRAAVERTYNFILLLKRCKSSNGRSKIGRSDCSCVRDGVPKTCRV